jgi:hypothetical protein
MSRDSVSFHDDDDSASSITALTADALLILPCDGQASESKLTDPAAQLCELLASSGFTLQLYSSAFKRNFLYATLRISKDLLEQYASSCEDIRLQMNPYALRAIFDYGDLLDTQLNYSLEYIFQPYSAVLEREKLYKFDVAGGSGVFQAPVRQAIVEHILNNKFCLESLQQNGVLIDFFPPHDEKQATHLWSECGGFGWFLRLNPWSVCVHRTKQLTALRDYLGKESAYYFVFLSHLINMTTLPFLLAVCVLCYKDTFTPILLGITLPFWLQAMIQIWERTVVQSATEWGNSLPSKSTVTRKCADASPWQLLVNPNFLNGVTNPSLLWPLPQAYVAPRSEFVQLLRVGQSVLVSAFMLFFTVFVLLLIMFLVRSIFTGLGFTSELMLLIVPLLEHGLLAVFLARTFDGICECLTNLENHRTKIGYHRALLSKSIVWRMCIFPSPAFYIAFLQENLEGSCYFSACSSAAGTAALIVFTIISVSDLFSAYFVPYISKVRRIQFLARNQTSLQSLVTLSTNPIVSSTLAHLEAGAGAGGKDPKSSREMPVFHSQVSSTIEKEFLTLQKSARPDRDWDDRSCYAAHYDMQVSLVIKLFLMVCFGGISPVIIILAVVFACLEIKMAISGSIFVRRRSFGPYNSYPGINDNIITALKVVTLISAWFVPILYVTVTHGPISSITGSYNAFQKLLVFCVYTWLALLFNYGLNTFYPTVSDKIKLVQAKQQFFDDDLKRRLHYSPANSPSNDSVSIFEEHSQLHEEGNYAGNGVKRMRPHKQHGYGSRARDWQDIEGMQQNDYVEAEIPIRSTYQNAGSRHFVASPNANPINRFDVANATCAIDDLMEVKTATTPAGRLHKAHLEYTRLSVVNLSPSTLNVDEVNDMTAGRYRA